MQTVNNKPTPRQLEDAIHSGPRSEAAVRELYTQREVYVAALTKSGSIRAEDLVHLDRLGRFQVADQNWLMCTQSARESLLNDPHAHVRSAANVSWQRNPTQ